MAKGRTTLEQHGQGAHDRWDSTAKGRKRLEQHGQGHTQGFLIVRNQRVPVQAIVNLVQLVAQEETSWCEVRWMM